MDLFDAIANRHSYRGSFLDEPIPRKNLERIVEAGLAAPSGMNAQTTQFVIVDDESILEPIRTMHPKNKAMQQARAFIACIVDKEPPAVYQDISFQVEDCAAAVENMLLAITALGYASVWIDGWLRREENAEKIGRLLHIPENKIIRIVLPIGAADREVRGPEKRPFEQRAWFNRYPG